MFKIHDDIQVLRKIHNSKIEYSIFVDYNFYKKWKYVIWLIIKLHKGYINCEIFRKKYKHNTNIVVVGLKWNGRNVKRRTSGYAKQIINRKKPTPCIYCGNTLNNDNATADHIIPVSKGGNNSKLNLIVCCLPCNGERGNMNFKKFLYRKNKYSRRFKRFFI